MRVALGVGWEVVKRVGTLQEFFFFFFTALPCSFEVARLCFGILRNLVSFASNFSTIGKHFACNNHVYVPFFICTFTFMHWEYTFFCPVHLLLSLIHI